MSNICKHQCPIFSGVCNPNECEVIKKSLADTETASEPIQNALYAAGFTTEQCDLLADGILQYIEDAGLSIIKRRQPK